MNAIEIWNKFLADKQQMSDEDELVFVRDGSDEWILNYTQEFSLGENAELLLIKSRSFFVVLDYILCSEEPFFIQSEKALLERKDTNLILKYARKFGFVQELHEFMAETASDDVLRAYFTEEQLSSAGEIKLIERHDEKLFQAYVEEHVLNKMSEHYLIKMKNYDFFKIYVSEHGRIAQSSLNLLANSHDEKLLDIFREFCLC